MSKRLRETVADWLMTVAALILLVSLFLPWSHQISASLRARYGPTGVLQGVPASPDAWQVYSIADVLLALLAAGLLAVALWGGRTPRRVLAVALAVGLAFVIHALGAPPTNGVLVFDPATGHYAATGAGAGAGAALALAALVLGAAGVVLSYSVGA